MFKRVIAGLLGKTLTGKQSKVFGVSITKNKLEYRVIGLLSAVEFRFAPSCLDEHVGCKRLFDRVDLADFDEHHLNVDDLLTLQPRPQQLLSREPGGVFAACKTPCLFLFFLSLSASFARLFFVILFCKVSSKSLTLCHLNLFV